MTTRPAPTRHQRGTASRTCLRGTASRTRQRGTALLMAMITLTLVATLTAGMVWQQWRAIQVEAAERARSQAAWILTGAQDWARLILREDARTDADPKNQPARDHLDEPWAVQLAEAPLSTFLGADQDTALNADEGIAAFLSGQIVDAQSRYNLHNLGDLGDGAEPTAAAAETQVFARLCEALGLPADVAVRVVRQWNRSTAAQAAQSASEPEPDTANGGGLGSGEVPAPAVFGPSTVSQLTWLGLEPEVVQRLAPYVDILPERTTVNINTAPPEVLIAVLGIDRGLAERLVQARRGSGFADLEDAAELLPATSAPNPRFVSVTSKYFEIRGRLRYEDAVLEERSIIQREGQETRAIRRERVRPGS